ncbi:hypothetical protein [Actinoplanes flavus]|uniref:Uncharacterized protein n=1 Tax=Actinoplanes flavus TaxID=2820290 RepID=A0ABS3UGS6_9ACTN|nr:hypothetical protein [Actinoplanes flavus]MBO3737989.1 hypothetical protein [Actinoplanes flavus]
MDNHIHDFRVLPGSLIMDVVPKRLYVASALILIIVASLVMALSGSLDGAAAWANIMALPVAIMGVILVLRGSGGAGQGAKIQDPHQPGDVVQSGGTGPVVNQIGFGQNQYNIAGNFIAREGDEHGGR